MKARRACPGAHTFAPIEQAPSHCKHCGSGGGQHESMLLDAEAWEAMKAVANDQELRKAAASLPNSGAWQHLSAMRRVVESADE